MTAWHDSTPQGASLSVASNALTAALHLDGPPTAGNRVSRSWAGPMERARTEVARVAGLRCEGACPGSVALAPAGVT
ncbi:hypothetical protein EDD94_5405 [Streptomyces sp. PanSC9]|nr:hypothetical protein EDD94_5405 [Streptomyces sp. PanSC9]